MQSIINVWQDFYEIYDLLRSFDDFGRCSVASQKQEGLRVRVKMWLEAFVAVYHNKHVTPYMHLLVNHAADIIQRHGSLSVFSAQGLEKLNHLITVDYFKCTNHWQGIQALDQLMRKQNRKIWLSRNQIKLQRKHNITCSRCHAVGHNSKTCC